MVGTGISSGPYTEEENYIKLIRASYEIKKDYSNREICWPQRVTSCSNSFRITSQIVNYPYFSCIFKMVSHLFFHLWKIILKYLLLTFDSWTFLTFFLLKWKQKYVKIFKYVFDTLTQEIIINMSQMFFIHIPQNIVLEIIYQSNNNSVCTFL